MAHRPTRAPADAPPFTPTSIPMLGRDWPIYRRDLFGFGLQFRQGPHEQLYFVRVDRKGRVQGKSTPVEQADVARWGGAFAAALKRAYRLVVPATVLSLALSMAVIAQVLVAPYRGPAGLADACLCAVGRGGDRRATVDRPCVACAGAGAWAGAGPNIRPNRRPSGGED